VTTIDAGPPIPRAHPPLAGLARRGALIALPLAGLLAWQLVVWLAEPEPWLLPAPADVARVLWDERERMWFHARATIAAAGLGFVLAAMIGTALAVALAWSRILGRTLHPWLVASQAIPILAVAPLVAVWLDYGVAQVMVAFTIAFFPVVVTGIDGLRGVDPALGAALRTLGAGRRRVFLTVTAPGALPSLFSGLKLAAVFSVTGAVVAEYVGSDRGLGYLSEFSTAQFRTDRSFAAVVLLGLIGVAFFGAVALLERLALPHRHHPTRPSWRKR
jgi:ABC-type nitrate/sulfonate/bicarbonate transport system permease component